MRRGRFLHFVLLGLVCALTACSTVQTPSKDDPFEGFNRTVFSFNQTVDRVALKPVAKTYNQLLPKGVRKSVTNFFSNIGDIYTLLNDLLQGDFKAGAEDTIRLTINSLLGVGGLFDVATEARMPKHRQDFGRTLAFYGVHSGPYVVLPLFGPSTVRDTAGFVVDRVVDPTSYIHPIGTRNTVYVVRLVNTRAALLQATNLFSSVAFDQYAFERDAFLQHRRSLTHDDANTGFNYEDEDEDEDKASGGATRSRSAHMPTYTDSINSPPKATTTKPKTQQEDEAAESMTVPPSQMMPPVNYFPNFRFP